MKSNEEFVRYLGEGAYGYVNLVRYSNPNDGSSYLSAVKNSPEENFDSLQSELQILLELRGYPNIVTCFGDYLQESFTRFGEKLYKLQLEYASEGSLRAFMDKYADRKLPERLIKDFTGMVLEGLGWVHGHGYAHCDIKPDNLLVFPCSSEGGSSSYEIKISDFGNALELGEVPKFWETEVPWVGTAIYMSPESIRDGVATMSLDLWSVGCLVLEMYTGVIPWESLEIDDIATRLLSAQAPEIPETLPSDAKDFIQTCFSRKPEERGSASELLSHPFLSQIPETLPSDAKDFIQTCFSRKPEERGSASELLSHPFLSRPEVEVEEAEDKKTANEKTTNSFLLKVFKLRMRRRSSNKKPPTDALAVSDKKPLKLRFFPTNATQFKRTLNKVLRLKFMPLKKSTYFSLVSVH
ncbi:unnamed protein product [Eruca vesicaria subsp. sativa]|uniref:Protein kinase domain-containing protein n=1 Tax=Eruca vesicaria subsp. sativa TaxID=29727 RepID=A0ABC8KXA6_ERUVS|nr:unnamed protein product [Eruca vesicaria subsp. sativa]